MRSVADALRRDLVVRLRRSTPDQRLQQAFALAEADAAAFASARGLSHQEAVNTLRRQRQHNRRTSKARLASLP